MSHPTCTDSSRLFHQRAAHVVATDVDDLFVNAAAVHREKQGKAVKRQGSKMRAFEHHAEPILVFGQNRVVVAVVRPFLPFAGLACGGGANALHKLQLIRYRRCARKRSVCGCEATHKTASKWNRRVLINREPAAKNPYENASGVVRSVTTRKVIRNPTKGRLPPPSSRAYINDINKIFAFLHPPPPRIIKFTQPPSLRLLFHHPPLMRTSYLEGPQGAWERETCRLRPWGCRAPSWGCCR